MEQWHAWTVKQLDGSDRESFKSEHLKSVQTLFDEQGLWLNMEMLVSIGKVPVS